MSILKTNRLTLRPFEKKDAHAMFHNWTYDECVARYCRWYPHQNISVTEDLLNMYLEEAAQGFDQRWVIVLNETDTPIGAIEVVDELDHDKTAEIGYLLSHHYWNKGYITEALTIVIEYLFQQNFTKIIGLHHIDNLASGKVMEKCGMHYVGLEKAQLKFGSDETSDYRRYEIEKF